MTTLTISIGRNYGYNPSKILTDNNWNEFRVKLSESIRENGFEVLVETNGISTYTVGQNLMEEETRQYVLALPSDRETGPLLAYLEGLATAYGQEEIAVTYGVYKPVAAK